MYKYKDLMEEIEELRNRGIVVGEIGVSEMGNSIPYLHLGTKTGKQIIVQGAIHAREHVTALLIMRQVRHIIDEGEVLDGGIYFVPMTNPDGNILVEQGEKGACHEYAELLGEIFRRKDHSLYKGNARGVDLNTNFNARWSCGKGNSFVVGEDNFVGDLPHSEAETKALVRFTISVSPDMTVSYHALGQEIYWYFHQTPILREAHRLIAQQVSQSTGYKLVMDRGSAGGYKDWCIAVLGIPAITIEIVSDNFSHPLGDESIESDWIVSKNLPKKLLEILNESNQVKPIIL